MFFLEQVADHMRLLLTTMQVPAVGAHHFRPAGRSVLAERNGLHALIQEFVRVQFETIARQPDQAQTSALSATNCLTAREGSVTLVEPWAKMTS
ncbi:hypothetical protein [Paraburkholderia sp. SIMBA_053]|uniref:hypothetical protein n=1 Tax=Paraburkholderia sp. SIMBA_053 TaxID=3085794 RepID=UPI00397C6629